MKEAFQKGVTEGRDGKGIIYVFAAGNERQLENINAHIFEKTRYTITVGAVSKKLYGWTEDYSTSGTAVFVSAPAGNREDSINLLAIGGHGTCINSGSGTSFAAPIVTGVIALMLEARPDLTWRDVQGILAVTSEKIHDPDDSSAHKNSAGFWHSHWYGFGIIDAKKAVDTAITWELWPPEQQVVGESARENQPFPDISETEYVSELTINHKYKTGFISESVVVSLNLKHYNHGRLKLTLVSPSGTESILNDGNSSEHGILGGSEKLELMTLRSWGEDPTGVWQLKVRDFSSKGVILSNENVFLDWVLVVYGRVRRPKVSCWQVPSYAKRYSPDCGGASWDELVKTCQEADVCDCIPSEYKQFNPDCYNKP